MPYRYASPASAAALLLGAIAVGPPALAHHSFAIFDKTKSVTVTGTVKSFQWENPHVWITLLVNDAKSGKQVVWPIEAASTLDLDKQGWSRHALAPGDTVTITMQPLRSGQIGGSLVSAKKNGVQIGHGWR